MNCLKKIKSQYQEPERSRGEGDAYPEAGFYMVGNLKEAYEQAKRIAAE